MKKELFIKNVHNITIKKCCASCKHKSIGKNAEQRICMKGEGEVKKDYLCLDWKMSEVCNNYKLGKSGRVKNPTYIQWLRAEVTKISQRDISEEEGFRILAERNEPVKTMTNIVERARMALINDLPRVYEKQFGNRYI